MYAQMSTLGLQSIVFISIESLCMIVTYEQDRIVSHAFLLASQGQLWHRAHLELAIPYFFLTYELAQGPACCGQTEIFWQYEQLLDFCAQIARAGGCRLVQLALVSPSWMNKQIGWRMHTIREIWTGLSTDRTRPLTFYITKEGHQYSDDSDDCLGHLVTRLLSTDESGEYIVENLHLRS